MGNFVRADFHRIMTRRTRIILMILMAAGECLFLVFKSLQDTNNMIQVTLGIGKWELVYIFGIMLVNILVIYGEDLNAKSMQVAIGIGIERHQIVIAKWISMVLMVVLDVTFLTVIQFITVAAVGKLAGGFAVELVVMGQIAEILQIIMVTTLTMILIFQMQKAIFGVLAYIYMMLNITGSVIQLGIQNKIVQRFQLWTIGVANQSTIFSSKLEIGEFDIRNFAMLLMYLFIGIGGTIYLFRKKEIEI